MLAPPYLYSGPSPIASLATTIAGLEVNRVRGDIARFAMWQRSHRVLDALRDLGIVTPNESGFPIIEIPLADHEEIDDVGRYLFDEGIYTTMAAYPLVPKDEVGFRIQVTAANTDEEIDHLIEVLGSLRDRFQLHQAASASTQAALRVCLDIAWSRRSQRVTVGLPHHLRSPLATPDTDGTMRSRAWAIYLSIGGALLTAFVFVHPIRVGPLFNVIGLSASDRDRDRREDEPAHASASRGTWWRRARRCSSPATSSRTTTSGSSAPLHRSPRSATCCTSASIRS